MNEVTTAIECTKAIEELIDNPDIRKKYAQRARSLHTHIFSLGAAHVVSITAARSSRNAVETGLQLDDCRQVVERIKATSLGPEEKSYALYGAVLLYALRKLGYLQSTTLADALLELIGAASDTMAYRQADWLKRLAEAYFK